MQTYSLLLQSFEDLIEIEKNEQRKILADDRSPASFVQESGLERIPRRGEDRNRKGAENQAPRMGAC